MPTSSNLSRLAESIHDQLAKLQLYLKETDQSEPAFDGQVRPTDWSGIEDTRSDCLELLRELQDLLYTPRELLAAQAATDLLSRHAFDRFDVYRFVPINGSISYEDLAQSTKVPIKPLRRLVRHGVSQRIFHEPQPGHLAHTQVSRLLTEDVKVRDYWGTICQEVWPAATRTVDALQKSPDSQQRNESGYQLAHGRTIYETLAADAVKQARYDSAMGAHSTDHTQGLNPVLDHYDWAALGEATVVDVGGGVGTVSKALARRYPKLKFIVEDRADVLVKASTDDEEENVRSRIRFQDHDFFEPQPVHGADVYFIRKVMMEWSDDKAVEILQALKPALKMGAVILVEDSYLPGPRCCPLWQERKLRNSDLLALAIANGGSREAEEWRGLFDRAGPGFEYRGVKSVPNSAAAFIEAVWRGES